MIKNKIFFFSLLFLVLSFFGFSQNKVSNEIVNTGSLITGHDIKNTNCISGKYYIDGLFEVKKNSYVEYKIGYNNENNIKSYQFKLFSGNKLIDKVQNDKFIFVFKQPGRYKLIAGIEENNLCNYEIEKTINVYDKIYLYIGSNQTIFKEGVFNIFNQKNILFKYITLNENLSSQDIITRHFKSNIYYIKNADFLIINYNNLPILLDTFVSLSNIYNVKFSDKKIFISIENFQKGLIKKLLLKYMKKLNLKGIYLIEKDNLISFLLQGLLNNINQININKYGEYYTLSFKQTSKIYLFSYLVDYIIFNGFPGDTLSVLLVIAFSVLIITIFRQMIGFSVFSVYHPLFFSLALFILGFKFTLVLFFIAGITTFIVRLITKKIYLLYSPKIALLVILYVIFLVIFIGIDNISGLKLINVKAFSNLVIIFPIISILFVANKILYEGFNLLSYKWRVSFLEFLTISLVIWFLLSLNYLRLLFLSYPELILIILILNILIGRFTGLQLMEYFRFRPLIKKYFEEE